MSTEIIVQFANSTDVEKVDLTRVGIVAGQSEDGLAIIVEPDIDGWDGVREEVAVEILRSGIAAAGVWVEISKRETGGPVPE